MKNLSDDVKFKRRDYMRRYKEQQRRAKGVPKRGASLVNPRFDCKQLYEYIVQNWLTVEKVNANGTSRYLLNRIPASDSDLRFLRALKSEQYETAELKRVDKLATKYDLPLWELAEAAGRYKRDIRTARKTREVNRKRKS